MCKWKDKKSFMQKYRNDLQFKDENHFIFVLVSIMKIDKFIMMQMVHDINLLSDQSLLHSMWNGDEFGGKYVSCLDLATSVDNSESSCSNFFKDVIIVVHALLSFDINRLRNVLGIDIKYELIVIFDFAFLTSNLLASIRIN